MRSSGERRLQAAGGAGAEGEAEAECAGPEGRAAGRGRGGRGGPLRMWRGGASEDGEDPVHAFLVSLPFLIRTHQAN